MTHTYCITAIALLTCASTSGCSSKAGAQTPTAPSRMLTADTDASQLVAGTVTVPASAVAYAGQFQKVIDGPFVLTDFFWSGAGGPTVLYALPFGQDCTIPDPVYGLDGTNGRVVAVASSATGSRLIVKAGEELCASWTNNSTRSGIGWSGFKPY